MTDTEEHPDRPVTKTVWVRRQWNDVGMDARVRLEDLRGFHWSDISGGVMAPAIRPFIHAYVLCDAFIEGSVSHSCRHGRGPHDIKVCVIKKGNEAIFSEIETLAARVVASPGGVLD